MPKSPAAPWGAVSEERPTRLYTACLFFFVFPLFVPAVAGSVVYPFVLYGAFLLLRLRMTGRMLFGACAGISLAVGFAMVDIGAAMRLAAFALGTMFLLHTAGSERRTALLLRFGVWHAVIVIAQLVFVVSGHPLDFSEILRSVYGDLLPPTGIHVDYNAFSQLDVFFPRVAGLNREPAYASVLFLGLVHVSLVKRRWIAALILSLAVLCTLSKVVLPLTLAFLLLRLPVRRGVGFLATAGRVALFVGANVFVIACVKANIDLVEAAMALDNSFYHRLVGFHSLAESLSSFAAIGNSQPELSQTSIFADYEFLSDKRAFLDGSALSKIAVDFGLVAAALFLVIVPSVAASWPAVLAFLLASLFINILSVAPATILLFGLLSGLAYAPATSGVRAGRRSRHPQIGARLGRA